VEGLDAALEKAVAFREAGADMIFPEALSRLDQYQKFVQEVQIPILANSTEFGATPIFSKEDFAGVGVSMILYPLSAFRAMSKAALDVYTHILKDGHQRAVMDQMQTREELYQFLNYHAYEQKLDKLFSTPF